MNRYKFYYLIWLLPAYLLFLIIHQALVYNSIVDTYKDGTSYTADVVDFDFKQIAAQTNGYIVLRFETGSGRQIQEKLSLPVEMAGELSNSRVVPVRYLEGNFQEIVMIPTFNTQKRLVLANTAMASVGLLIALAIAIIVHRYTRKKLSGPEKKFVIERID